MVTPYPNNLIALTDQPDHRRNGFISRILITAPSASPAAMW